MRFNADNLKQKARTAAQSALFKAGQEVMDESLKIVPRKTGKLDGSSYIQTLGRDNPSVEAGYSADYAAAVHKKVDYLKGVFEASKNECEKIIKCAVEEAIK